MYPLFDCKGAGNGGARTAEGARKKKKKVMKHHWRGFYRDTVWNTNSRYLFWSIRIHYASECIIGGVAIDPVLNLIVRFLFSSGEPGGSGEGEWRGGVGKKSVTKMSW